MTKFVRMVVAAVGLSLIAGSAYAGDDIAASRGLIISGDMAQAERVLETERRIYPARQDVLLNLAAVYANSGRAREAAALYQRVLDRRDVLMDLDDSRTASAHSIANRGLSRIAVVQTASR